MAATIAVVVLCALLCAMLPSKAHEPGDESEYPAIQPGDTSPTTGLTMVERSDEQIPAADSVPDAGDFALNP
uniref:Hypothetical secreted protein n=1 Tax=Ornithodoros coriaceus TaxID=92741 RepID=B2D2G0_ORNCO|nr:hypothetical secreted protein precursor [Ornithodoros coriaceus]